MLLDRIARSATGAVKTVGAEGWESGLAGAKPALVLVPNVDEAADGRARHPVSLADHSDRVARHARRLASAACTADGIVHAVEIAARYHDHGKLDQRFQRWMYLGGDPDPRRPLAKSGIDPGSRRSRSARIAAGWPSDKRHEASSALLLSRSVLASDSSVDIDLAVYLVAVHHGRNRPFLPEEGPDLDHLEIVASIEGDQVTVRSSETLDWASHASLFARLNRRYSPWGLALVEATLVQADWLASREER
jgi:CRISPR-associated endonuclease/helicase Cas3